MAIKVTPVQQIKDMRFQLEVEIMSMVKKFNEESGMEVSNVEGLLDDDTGAVNEIEVDYQFPVEESEE